jgi:hypothetical protein
MQLITPTVILQLVVETDLAAAAIHLAIRDLVSKEQAHNKACLRRSGYAQAGLPPQRTG